MPRAEPIDRIALTKQRSRFLQAVEEMKQEEPALIVPDDEKCPVRGAVLLHSGGCVVYPNKCWSKCG